MVTSSRSVVYTCMPRNRGYHSYLNLSNQHFLYRGKPYRILNDLEVIRMNSVDIILFCFHLRSIEGNPIVCGCDAMWLINPREIFKDAIIRRPDKCFSGEERRSLKDLTWHDCGKAVPAILHFARICRALLQETYSDALQAQPRQ